MASAGAQPSNSREQVEPNLNGEKRCVKRGDRNKQAVAYQNGQEEKRRQPPQN